MEVRAIKVARRESGANPPASSAQDSINALPDEILVVILSRLPIRDAANTSCLARRWTNLWKGVPKLNLNTHTVGVLEEENEQDYEARAAEFIRKVDSILGARAGGAVGVELFSLWFPYLTSAHAAAVDHWWVALAESASRVERFVLETAGKTSREAMGVEPYEFQLDSLAAVGSQLREVKLTNCGLKMVPMPASPSFSLLTAVKLEFVSATGAQVRSLLEACGSLWNLVISCCHRMIRLRVAHARLRLLQVDRCRKLESMRILAPQLLSLRYIGHRIAVDYVCAPLLWKLELLLLTHCPLDCLGHLPRLNTLSLQFPSPLAVHTGQLWLDGRLAGLRTIRLFLQNAWSDNIVSVAYLLQAAPLVQTLQLEGSGDEQSAPPRTELTIRWPQGFSANRLRTVSIGRFDGEPELIELGLFLLRTSPRLKTLSIYTRRLRRPMEKAEKAVQRDPARREHARDVALAKLAPRVPSRMTFTAC